MILQLPHELPLDSQRRVLRRWCDEQLGQRGLSFHAAIHEPEAGNDPRNWHAHVLIAPCAVHGDASDWKLERISAGRLRAHDHFRMLARHAPGKTAAAVERMKAMRAAFATIANDELEKAGHRPRLTHLSFKDQGRDDVPVEPG